MVAIFGPGTPYITPAVLKRAPTGIDWTTIPSRSASTVDQAAEAANICLRATGMIEGVTNQTLRATLDEEWFSGPDYRVTINRRTGTVRFLVSRWPILQVISATVSPDVFPRTWQTVTAPYLDIEKPPIGLFGAAQAADVADGGQAILMSPGFLDWSMGRNGWRVQLIYVNGWPHTSLTAMAANGSQTIAVDDCTGWAPSVYDPTDMQFGATGIFYDGTFQEVAQCVGASAQSGTGTLTLNQPLSFQHSAGVLFTTLPRTVMNATIDMASSIALERGATATEVQTMSGGGGSGGGPLGVHELRTLAEVAVQSYARVILWQSARVRRPLPSPGRGRRPQPRRARLRQLSRRRPAPARRSRPRKQQLRSQQRRPPPRSRRRSLRQGPAAHASSYHACSCQEPARRSERPRTGWRPDGRFHNGRRSQGR